MSTIRLGSISLECAEPATLAAFWASLLGGEIAFESDDFVAVKLDGVWLSTVKVENYRPPTWPNDEVPTQMHLDLAVDNQSESEAAAIALGAVKAEFQPEPLRWTVMFDLAGHPFCLTTLIPE
jgi:hypothetical protein